MYNNIIENVNKDVYLGHMIRLRKKNQSVEICMHSIGQRDPYEPKSQGIRCMYIACENMVW